MDRKRSSRQWETLPLDPEERNGMGQRYHPERRLVRREGRCDPCRNHGVGPPRPEENLREIVPRSGRRTGTDSIPAGARIRPDYRTVHRMQAEPDPGGKRSASVPRRRLTLSLFRRYREGDFAIRSKLSQLARRNRTTAGSESRDPQVPDVAYERSQQPRHSPARSLDTFEESAL